MKRIQKKLKNLNKEEMLEREREKAAKKMEEQKEEEIRKELGFTTLQFNRLDDMLAAVEIDPCKLCTYCWNGKE